MQRTLITPNLDIFPAAVKPLICGADIYDSSCSPEARVYFIDKGCGYYLKCAAKGSLKIEADLTRYFNSKGLATSVLEYISLDKDWLLTEKVSGEDCTHKMYLDEPKRLCDTTAELLRLLHENDFASCPIQNRIETYTQTVIENYRAGTYDKSAFPDSFGYKSDQEAWAVAEKYMHCLKNDTLLHGDYCLPNIMLDNWKFSKFIDLGNGGVGDRHIDIFWGIWTLFFNLKTDKYTERFMDAYGRDKIESEMLKVVAACEVFG
ncbi:MAG: aminoglycoside 3'-phosphotransferase [Clostridia bacterium]|nr:aminoglycoside 3'-phosphotransferase [Clostridia bacterium]